MKTNLLGGVALFALLLAASCGSKTSETPGASVAGSAGSAGASAAGTCAAGDTRTCVGPGACSGGQACGSTGQWSACDCGGSAGGGSTGGGSTGGGSASVAGSSGGPAGGVAGTTEGGGSGGLAGANEAGSPSTDDPCPSGAITADCSGQCDAKAAVCEAACGQRVVMVDYVDPTFLPNVVMMRTPSHPQPSCSCGIEGEARSAYEVTIIVKHPTSSTWHVSVPSPWAVSSVVPSDGCFPPIPEQCVDFVWAGNDRSMTVLTADPNAPAVNIVAELGQCP